MAAGSGEPGNVRAGVIKAVMPGKIVQVVVKGGDRVRRARGSSSSKR